MNGLGPRRAAALFMITRTQVGFATNDANFSFSFSFLFLFEGVRHHAVFDVEWPTWSTWAPC